jgi:uncharacterized protein YbjT (DUF2867 family)
VRVCIVGASGKLGQYMIEHALDHGYEVVGACREQSVPKLDRFRGCITLKDVKTRIQARMEASPCIRFTRAREY